MGGNSITPYFHILEHHVIEMIERSPFKSISHFQLQGQESKHQDHTTTLFRCSNWRENKSYSTSQKRNDVNVLEGLRGKSQLAYSRPKTT